MKKTTLFAAMLTSLLLLSCNDDDDLKLTKEEGLPGFFEQNDGTKIYVSYQGNQPTQVKKKNGSATTYKYEGGIPSEIIFTPPKDVADGHGGTSFIKEGDNKIRVESWGEPSSLLYVKEIELDKDKTPVKITNIGAFERGPEGLFKVYDGVEFVKITIDPITKNILKNEVFSLENSELLATYSYEYDNNPGTMSEIDWPLWLFIYYCSDNASYYDSYYRQFFNYKNNLVKETVDNKAESTTYTVNYTYTYSKNGYPVSATNDKFQYENNITIRY